MCNFTNYFKFHFSQYACLCEQVGFLLRRSHIREGGLCIVEPFKAAESQNANSLMITISLVSIFTGRSSATVLDAHDQMFKTKSAVHHSNWVQTREY